MRAVPRQRSVWQAKFFNYCGGSCCSIPFGGIAKAPLKINPPVLHLPSLACQYASRIHFFQVFSIIHMVNRLLVASLISNDAVVLGLLALTLAFVFKSGESSRPFFKKFYAVVPTVLLCYLIPGIFNSIGLISGGTSQVYFIASRYLLPASLEIGRA